MSSQTIISALMGLSFLSQGTMAQSIGEKWDFNQSSNCLEWILGNPKESCSLTCSEASRTCDPSQFQLIITQQEFYSMVASSLDLSTGAATGDALILCNQGVNVYTFAAAPAAFTYQVHTVAGHVDQTYCNYPTSLAGLTGDCDTQYLHPPSRRFCPCIMANCEPTGTYFSDTSPPHKSVDKEIPPSIEEDLSAVNKTPTMTSALEVRRTVEVYVSSIKVEDLGPGKGWRIALVGEVGAAPGQIRAIMRSMPHLSFCMESSVMAPWCYPVSDLLLDVHEPLQNLHLWAQVSSSGGKIRHSDVYISIDCRLPDGGFNLHQLVIGQSVYFEIDILENCVDSLTGARRHQRLRYPTRKFGATNTSCASTRRARFEHNMTAHISLQRSTTNFCADNMLTTLNCADFVYELQQHLWRILQGSQLQLPMIQYSPSRANPFLFVHIEKTAGSTLRTFIYESTHDNATTLIPCSTVGCAIFAVPRHLPPSQKITADPLVLLSELSDMRLVQAPAQDNSNLTVIAGHFDFYAAYESLPQCRAPEAVQEPLNSAWSPFRDDEKANVPRPTPVPTSECRVSCFTMGRHPVDRAISYYYQRFYRHTLPLSDSAEDAPFGGRPLEQRFFNELTVEQLEMIVRYGRDRTESEYYPGIKVLVDDGLSDSACRMMLGLRSTTGRPVGQTSAPPPIPPELYPLARHNLQQCVVGIQEHWNDSLRVLDHWFPWIDFSVEPARREHSNKKGNETRATLRPELIHVLEELNPCDMMLYEEMLRIFRIQLHVLDSPYTNTIDNSIFPLFK